MASHNRSSLGGMRQLGDEALTAVPHWAQRAWMENAACHGRTRLFFAPLAERPQARTRREAKARRVCEACPVLDVCRTYARVNLEYGFWGGESEEDRANAGYGVAAPAGRRSQRLDRLRTVGPAGPH